MKKDFTRSGVTTTENVIEFTETFSSVVSLGDTALLGLSTNGKLFAFLRARTEDGIALVGEEIKTYLLIEEKPCVEQSSTVTE